MSFPVIALERGGLEWINATRLHSLWMPNPRATGGRGNSPPIDSGNEWTIPPLTVSLTSLCSPSTLRLLHMFDAKTYFCLRYCTYTQAIRRWIPSRHLEALPAPSLGYRRLEVFERYHRRLTTYYNTDSPREEPAMFLTSRR